MFQPTVPKSSFCSFLATCELIFHVAVRDIRKSNTNAFIGLLISVFQSCTMLFTLIFMFQVLGMRGPAVRGDYMLYMMSGIFVYMTHVKTLRAVSKAEAAGSAIMKHAPMNTVVSICGQALAALYQQVLAAVVILFVYHTVFARVEIEFPVLAFCMILMAWMYGIGVGMIFKAATPWAPDLSRILITVYTSVNMIASGKMFLANAMPTRIMFWFSWNPLFHIIDQSRGFVFLNYNPHYTSLLYPVAISFVLILLGLMIDTLTRHYVSASWSAGK
ncbi:MAG: ABC transporter permease [Alphaproteobacteria bacterium]|jgi:ABC-type polysaccharide/polyol phosphate export permease